MKKNVSKEIEIEGDLNEVIFLETRRPDGSLRIQQDFQFCPSMAEQHSAHLTDINYLIEKYTPDELVQYIQAKDFARREIIGHDFSQEPNLQEGMNVVYGLRKAYDELSPDIKMHFKNHVEFVKFIDNPANQEKMIKIGLLKQKDIEKLSTKVFETAAPLAPTTTTITEAKESKPN